MVDRVTTAVGYEAQAAVIRQRNAQDAVQRARNIETSLPDARVNLPVSDTKETRRAKGVEATEAVTRQSPSVRTNLDPEKMAMYTEILDANDRVVTRIPFGYEPSEEAKQSVGDKERSVVT